MPDTTTTPQSGSLDDAGRAILGLLSTKVEDTQTAEPTQSEQPPKKEVAEQTPAAPEPSESEPETQSQSEADGETEATQQPRKYPVKVDGQDAEATLDELLKSYSFTEHNTRKSQQIAEEKRALEAERKRFEESDVAAVRAERQQYATYLEELKTALAAMSPEEPNWAERRQQLPADEFAAELLTWQVNQKRVESVKAEQAKVKAAQEADAHAGYRSYVQDQEAKLIAALPALKDPEKAKAIKADLKEFAVKRGFSEQDLASVTDHRLVLILHDAMELEKSKAKAPAIKSIIENAMDTSQPGAKSTPKPRNDLAAAKARVKESHSVDDAASAIRHLI